MKQVICRTIKKLTGAVSYLSAHTLDSPQLLDFCLMKFRRRHSFRSPLLRAALLLLAGGAGAQALAATYTLPIGTDTVVGEVQKVVAAHEDTLLDIGRRYGVGYEEIVAANPGISPWLPGAGTEVLIPSRYILPDGPREGIVVSLAEHRLFYFPPHKATRRRWFAPIPSASAGWIGTRRWADAHRQQAREADLVSAGVGA